MARIKTRPWDPLEGLEEDLASEEDRADYLCAGLEEGNLRVVVRNLGHILQVRKNLGVASVNDRESAAL